MTFPSGDTQPGHGGGPGPGESGCVPVARFSTAGLAPGDRFAAWGRAVAVLFELHAPSHRPATHHPAANFAAALTTYHFGAFLLCHSRADAARYIRTEHRTRRDDLDHYLIHLPLQQSGGFGPAGALRRLRPLDVGIFDLTLPAGYAAGAGEAISLIVPRATLATLLKEPNQQHGRILRRDRPMVAVLARHIIALHSEAPRFGLHEASALASTAINLIAICLGFDGNAAARAPPPASGAGKENLARKIRVYIEQNLHRETLTPDMIVSELLISRSQLYRQFERFGGVRHYMRRRRLRRCLLAICNPLQAGQRIADIAYEQGFGDEAHFSRLFREAFGLSPREARLAAQRGDGAVLDALVPAASDATPAPFTHWIRELAIP